VFCGWFFAGFSLYFLDTVLLLLGVFFSVLVAAGSGPCWQDDAVSLFVLKFLAFVLVLFCCCCFWFLFVGFCIWLCCLAGSL
jgi:uncharacterized YccA/Bax inhibitor family protein